MAGGLVFVLVFIGIDYVLERVADGDWPIETYKLRIWIKRVVQWKRKLKN